jgi:hypothetical protein
VTSPSQRPLPDKTQHSQETDIRAPGRIRTHNPSKLPAVDPRLRPHGHWDRLCIPIHMQNITWYLMVINIWSTRWLEVNLCLQVFLKADESFRLKYHTHCWMYPMTILPKNSITIRVIISFSCLVSLYLGYIFFLKPGVPVNFWIPCNVSTNIIFWILYWDKCGLCKLL